MRERCGRNVLLFFASVVIRKSEEQYPPVESNTLLCLIRKSEEQHPCFFLRGATPCSSSTHFVRSSTITCLIHCSNGLIAPSAITCSAKTVIHRSFEMERRLV